MAKNTKIDELDYEFIVLENQIAEYLKKSNSSDLKKKSNLKSHIETLETFLDQAKALKKESIGSSEYLQQKAIKKYNNNLPSKQDLVDSQSQQVNSITDNKKLLEVALSYTTKHEDKIQNLNSQIKKDINSFVKDETKAKFAENLFEKINSSEKKLDPQDVIDLKNFLKENIEDQDYTNVSQALDKTALEQEHLQNVKEFVRSKREEINNAEIALHNQKSQTTKEDAFSEKQRQEMLQASGRLEQQIESLSKMEEGLKNSLEIAKKSLTQQKNTKLTNLYDSDSETKPKKPTNSNITTPVKKAFLADNQNQETQIKNKQSNNPQISKHFPLDNNLYDSDYEINNSSAKNKQTAQQTGEVLSSVLSDNEDDKIQQINKIQQVKNKEFNKSFSFSSSHLYDSEHESENTTITNGERLNSAIFIDENDQIQQIHNDPSPNYNSFSSNSEYEREYSTEYESDNNLNPIKENHPFETIKPILQNIELEPNPKQNLKYDDLHQIHTFLQEQNEFDKKLLKKGSVLYLANQKFVIRSQDINDFRAAFKDVAIHRTDLNDQKLLLNDLNKNNNYQDEDLRLALKLKQAVENYKSVNTAIQQKLQDSKKDLDQNEGLDSLLLLENFCKEKISNLEKSWKETQNQQSILLKDLSKDKLVKYGMSEELSSKLVEVHSDLQTEIKNLSEKSFKIDENSKENKGSDYSNNISKTEQLKENIHHAKIDRLFENFNTVSKNSNHLSGTKKDRAKHLDKNIDR